MNTNKAQDVKNRENEQSIMDNLNADIEKTAQEQLMKTNNKNENDIDSFSLDGDCNLENEIKHLKKKRNFCLCNYGKIAELKIVIILEDKKEITFEEELSSDVIELMTVFCAKLYGKRSHRNKLQNNKKVCYNLVLKE